MKKILIKFCLFMLTTFFLQGCATAFLTAAPNNAGSTTHYKNFDTDTIQYFATPKAENSQYKGIVLVGQKYLYHLDNTDSIEQFGQLTQYLDPQLLEFDRNIKIHIRDTKDITAIIKINYNKPHNLYSDKEEKALKTIKCSRYDDKPENLYEAHNSDCHLALYGKLYKKSESNSLPTSNNSLSQALTVKLITVTNTPNLNVEKLTALPITLAFDVVTSPLQLLYILSNGN
ncbi:MAG: hypothetical protein KGV56_00745 [Gammaproteobacteria bacterium]|nr:hypothetical protein [Gammaproteobacteria bacterium]